MTYKSYLHILAIPFVLSLLLIILRFNFNYLIFHSFAEYFAVFVSFGITLVAYNTYSFTNNRYLLFIGLGYFWVALLDMLHTQTYLGMPYYNISTPTHSLNFWILNRILEASILLIAPFMRNVQFSISKVTSVFALIFFIILYIAIYKPLNLFVVGVGLTILKISLEYFVIFLLSLAIYIYKKRKDEFNTYINHTVILSMVLTILSELSFTMYTDVYGIMNVVGHILKFVSFWVLLQAIIKTSLSEPFSLMQTGSSTYNSIPIPAILIDNEGSIKQVNNAACEFIGMREIDILNQSNHELFHPNTLSKKECPICNAINHHDFIKNFELKDDKGNYTEFSLSPIKSNKDTLQGTLQVSVDITKRKILQEDLQNNFGLLDNIINSIPIRIFWKDRDGNYMGANNLFLKDAGLTSVNQIIGKNDFDMVWSNTQAKLYREDDLKIIQTDTPKLQFEEELTNGVGKTIVLSTSKVPLKDIHNTTIGILGVYEDITRRREIEKTLLQQTKMAQMGEMISMIAHQWRQPLGSISATSINLQMKLELDALEFDKQEKIDQSKNYLLEKLHDIDEYVAMLTTTIDDFRNFYKSDKKFTHTKLRDTVDKSLKVIQTSIVNQNIKLIKDYQDDSFIDLYEHEMMQVILNILKNAQDNFMEREQKDAYIKISTKNKLLEICDNGGGIDEKILDHIFDPYFSTKSEKNGTGLGLYMSKTIVQEHHDGMLSAHNTPDGICFSIYFKS